MGTDILLIIRYRIGIRGNEGLWGVPDKRPIFFLSLIGGE